MIRPLIAIFLATILFTNFGFGQDTGEQPEDNWLKDLKLYSNEQLLYHRYDRYSLEDIGRFKARVTSVRNGFSEGEWEGSYFFDFPDSVTFSQLSWSVSGGFFSLSVYTCLPELRSLQYGSVEVTGDSVLFNSENVADKGSRVDRYIRVRWGKSRYLVNEKSLAAFAEKAAGRYVEPEEFKDENYQKWADYWVSGDGENGNSPAGLPAFPNRFKHLERKPLSTKIASIRGRKIESDIEMGNRVTSGPSAVYYIRLDSRSLIGLARGMTLVNSKTGEEIYIRKVDKAAAIGILVRSIDETGQDDCFNDEGTRRPCPNLVRGSSYTTKTGSFWW